MKTFVLVHDEQETEVPEAPAWESALAARLSNGEMGVGTVLRAANGSPLLGAFMTPEQALETAKHLFHIAIRMRFYENRAKAHQAITDMLAETTLASIDHHSRAARR